MNKLYPFQTKGYALEEHIATLVPLTILSTICVLGIGCKDGINWCICVNLVKELRRDVDGLIVSIRILKQYLKYAIHVAV